MSGVSRIISGSTEEQRDAAAQAVVDQQLAERGPMPDHVADRIRPVIRRELERIAADQQAKAVQDERITKHPALRPEGEAMTADRQEVIHKLVAAHRRPPEQAALELVAVEFEFSPPPTNSERAEAARLAVEEGNQWLTDLRDAAATGADLPADPRAPKTPEPLG